MDDDIWNRAPGLIFENEAAVETRLIVPLLRALGYNEEDHIVPKYPVVFQEGRRGRRPEADIVVFAEQPHSRATSLVTVEAKHPNEELSGGKEQGESYAANVRSPLLMISNGRRIQLWQYQPTYESELVLDCSVTELPVRRGEIETLLAREAVMAHAKTMLHKSFGLVARDLGAYERSEFDRRDGNRFAISRRLVDIGSSSGEIASTSLLADYSEGATIFAASGYGKTTLANELRRQALKRRWSGESTRLPIEIFLPDAPPSQEGLETFLHGRVVAHCPVVSPAAFRERLRCDGIVLIADGFDRVPTDRRPSVEGALITFRRDFPNTQLFLLTRPILRPERLALPSVELMELSGDEQLDLIEQFAVIEGCTAPYWYGAPDVLQKVCHHPLILQLTLAHYKVHGRLPLRIEALFQTWLSRLLPSSLPLARRADLKRLLTCFANATVDGPLTEAAAVELGRCQGFSDDLLQFLLEADALVQRGATVELQHEALADYLRALDVVERPATQALQRLKALPLREGSQLPALLMAVGNSAEMQRLVWAEVASADITAAMTALRYRADLSLSNAPEPRLYLSEIIEGIELPLQIHFPRLAARIQFGLVGCDTERLGIVGDVQPKSGLLSYSFVARDSSEDQVTVGRADGAGNYHGKNLLKMGLRLDSGRLVGMSHLRDGLLELVKERRLDGGVVWAEERTLGRLRHLVREYDLPYTFGTSLEHARDLLIQHAGEWVAPGALRSGQTFAIDDLVAEIEFLIQQGLTHLEPWWAGAESLDLTGLEGRARLSELFDAHHRRTQLAYREVVETSFPLLAEKLPFYQVIPVRYEIEVAFHERGGCSYPTQHWKWVPVATFGNAGATVTFPSTPSELWTRTLSNDYRHRIDEALTRYGRPAPDRYYGCGHGIIPDFACSPWTDDGQVDETSVLSAAAVHIQEDLKYLFRELPESD